MILFLGLQIYDEYEEWFRNNSKTVWQESSLTHQKSIIKGLRNYAEVYDINEISGCGIWGIRFKKAFVRGKLAKDHETINSSNIPIFRLFYNSLSWFKAVEKKIKEAEVEAIVVYMPFVCRAFITSILKKRHKEIPVIIVVPDLIKHSYRRSGNILFVKIKKVIRYIQHMIVDCFLKNVDGFVFLTKKMHEEIGKTKPYIVQEAVYNMERDSIYQDRMLDISLFNITYCGKVSHENGVDRLVMAFMKLKQDDIRLNICGDGELLEDLREKVGNEKRIVFWGNLSHEIVKQIQSESSVLINPRYTYLDNVAYSFPSKLIEYMACGKTVISSHLPGIPSEYDDYLIYIKNDSVEALKEVIDEVYGYTEEKLCDIGDNNMEFVKRYKSSEAQGKTLYNFVKSLCCKG